MLGLAGSPLRKPYSIASAPWELAKSGILQALVQVEDTGAPDPHLELAAPGTQIHLDGPFGTFGLPADYGDRPLLFVAGGTGIAPLRSMLIEHLSRPTKRRVALIYSARSADELAFRPELAALDSAGRIATYFTVTREEKPGWQGRRGRISEALLNEALLATADSRMYRDKTRRKQRVQVQPAATGTDGMPAVAVPLQPVQEITEIDIQRAGFGVL